MTRVIVALCVFLLLLASVSAIKFRTSASSQIEEALTLFDIGAAANATIAGAATDEHMTGSGIAGDFTPGARARAIATGDLNGDGFPDVILGAPDSTVTLTPPSGPPEVRAGAGAVYVVFGSASISGNIDSTTNALKIFGSKPGDRTGVSVAAGDVNGDGTDDLIIGAAGADFPLGSASPSRSHTGAAIVIFGSSSMAAGQVIDLKTTNSADVVIYGVGSNDLFGSSVAAGDAGGLSTMSAAQQLVKDILVGAPGVDVNGTRTNSGAAYLVFGGSQLNRTAGATTAIDLASASSPANTVLLGKQAGDLFGTQVAIGDVTGDGFGDLIVGAPLADRPAQGPITAQTDTGAAYVFLGGPNLTPSIGTSKTFDTNVTQQNVSVYGADTLDHLGASVAAGDVTGDGVADLLVGAPDADGPLNIRAETGEAYAIAGGARITPSIGSEIRVDVFTAFSNPLDPNNKVTLSVFGQSPGDHLGAAVAAGNVNIAGNNNATPDMLIGVPGFGGRSGAVSIIFGGPNFGLIAARDLLLSQDDARLLGQAPISNDASGKSLIVRETLNTTDLTVSPFLQKIFVSANASSLLNDDTQSDFTSNGGKVNTVAAATVIPSDATALGDLELASNPAVSLDGTTGSISVPNSASLQPASGNWTVEFWAKRTGTGTGDFPPIIGSRPWTSATDKGWAVALKSTGGTFQVSAHLGNGSAGFDLPTVESSGGSTINVWEHWAVVFDRGAGQVVFYKNGAVNATMSVTFPAGPIDQTDAMLIGKDPGGTRFYQGFLDDIRVWNVARSAAQINANFTSDLQGTESGLVAYYKFNAGTGVDSTSNANNGIASGGATFTTAADHHFNSGTRTTTIGGAFSALGVINSSLVSWVSTTPAGTSLSIETSTNGGATFAQAANGSGIPSLSIGDELGWALAAADINKDRGGDLIVGAPFANAQANGTRTSAGKAYIVKATIIPPTSSGTNPPSVTVTAPNGGETISVGSQFDITWTASDADGDDTIQRFEIRLSTNGGSSFDFIVAPSVAGAARKFTWTVPGGLNTTQGRIRIIASDSAVPPFQGQDDSNANFTIADVEVAATLISPNGGESLKAGQQFNITWDVPAAVRSRVKGFDLFLSTDGGLTFPLKIAPSGDPSTPALGPTVFNFAWVVPAICAPQSRIAVVLTSTTNVRTTDTSNASFSISLPGPTIDTTNMFLFADSSRFRFTTTTISGTEIRFADDALIEVSTDATGLTFAMFSKPPKIKAGGRKLLTKGVIADQDPLVFFPNGATRVVRFTNPPCNVSTVRVTRNGEQLILATDAVD